MVFNSLTFFLFFPAVTVLFFVLPHRFRWPFLLAASCYFYMFFIPVYILLLAFLIVVDYVAGVMIERTEGRVRKAWFIGSIFSTCSALFFFKYFNFFNTNLADFAEAVGWNYSIRALTIALPVGLSFHTFQSLSYVVEVYAGRQKAERHLGIYSLYVMFFPQLVAGPIERPQSLLPQLHRKVSFDPERVGSGLKLMLWGLFKKSVIADRLAVYVDQVYDSPAAHSGGEFILATAFFSFQIYCDFSGYSDIARGAARVLGFDLMKNFRFPYAATSVPEFWRRWHISLYDWLHDYVYKPMRSRLRMAGGAYVCLLLTFLFSGLWHGAGWNFILWGLLNGVYLLGYRVLVHGFHKVAGKRILSETGKFLTSAGTVLTFILISISWVLFRAPTAADAFSILESMGRAAVALPAGLPGSIFASGTDQILRVTFSIGLIILLLCLEALERRGYALRLMTRSPLRWAACYVQVLGIVFLGEFGSSGFIYYQF